MTDREWTWLVIVLAAVTLAAILAGFAGIAWVPAWIAGYALGTRDERRKALGEDLGDHIDKDRDSF